MSCITIFHPCYTIAFYRAGRRPVTRGVSAFLPSKRGRRTDGQKACLLLRLRLSLRPHHRADPGSVAPSPFLAIFYFAEEVFSSSLPSARHFTFRGSLTPLSVVGSTVRLGPSERRDNALWSLAVSLFSGRLVVMGGIFRESSWVVSLTPFSICS